VQEALAQITWYHNIMLIENPAESIRDRACFRGTGEIMTASEIVTAHRNEILAVAAKHGARNVRLFGSVARGSDDERSDIDLIVDFDPERSLLDHAALSLELQELLGHKVDIVSGRGLKPRIRDRVLTEAVPL
jgi:predicted nucleotidyltransferase